MLRHIEIVDKYIIRFKLKDPQSSLLAVFYGGSIQSPIVSPDSVKPDGSISLILSEPGPLNLWNGMSIIMPDLKNLTITGIRDSRM